jgi:Glycosyl hydrolase family 71
MRASILCSLLLASACGGSSTASPGDAGEDRAVTDASLGGKHDGHTADTGHVTHAPDASHAVDARTTADAKPTPDAHAVDAAPPNDDPCVPFVMPDASVLFASNKKVFAHYFYPFPMSIDNKPSATDYYNTEYLAPDGESGKHLANGGYIRQRPLSVPVSASTTWQLDNMEREVKMALAAGITGFTIDVLNADENAAGSHLQNLLTAAAAVDSRFKIVVMPDMSALGASSAGAAEETVVENIIKSVASSPAAYHLADGRLVVTAFDASLVPITFWTDVASALSTGGVNIAFVPTFLGWSGNVSTYAPMPYVYGFSDWGTATPQAATGSESWPATAHDAGKIFMMPVLSQQYRPKDFLFWEAQNSTTFRDTWGSAIGGGADWVQIVTWSRTPTRHWPRTSAPGSTISTRITRRGSSPARRRPSRTTCSITSIAASRPAPQRLPRRPGRRS